MKTVSLSRRRALRGLGLGVSLALPPLEAMRNGRGHFFGLARAATKPPVRLVTYFFPNGTDLGQWEPKTEGADWEMKPALAPIEPHRARVNVLSGLDNTPGLMSTLAHEVAAAAFATGVAPSGINHGGPSIDQVAAQKLGGATRFPSLVLGVDAKSGVPYLGSTSASGKGKTILTDNNPANVFNRLVGGLGGGPGPIMVDPLAEREAARRKSVLDYVKTDAARLAKRLGAEDVARIDEHLTSVRQLEKELFDAPDPATGRGCARPEALAAPKDNREKGRMMLRLMTFAMKCDLSRYFAFVYSGAISGTTYPWLGINEGDHNISHSGPSSLVAKKTAFHVGELAYFLGELQAVDEGAGTLLDNSVVYFGSEVASGYQHTKRSMPILLAGRAGGQLRPGRHIRYGGVTTNELLLALLHMVGVPAPSFGIDGAKPLPGLG